MQYAYCVHVNTQLVQALGSGLPWIPGYESRHMHAISSAINFACSTNRVVPGYRSPSPIHALHGLCQYALYNRVNTQSVARSLVRPVTRFMPNMDPGVCSHHDSACDIQSLPCTLYSVHCTVYSVHCTVYTTRSGSPQLLWIIGLARPGPYMPYMYHVPHTQDPFSRSITPSHKDVNTAGYDPQLCHAITIGWTRDMTLTRPHRSHPTSQPTHTQRSPPTPGYGVQSYTSRSLHTPGNHFPPSHHSRHPLAQTLDLRISIAGVGFRFYCVYQQSPCSRMHAGDICNGT